MWSLLLAMAHAGQAECPLPEQQIEPLTRVAPRVWGHPRRWVDGHVVLSVTVDAAGAPTKMDVVCTTVENALTQASERAVRRWKFAPSVDVRSGSVLFKFTMKP